MTLMRIDPMEEFRQMNEVFDRLFAAPRGQNSGARMLPIDVLEQESALIIRAAVPGVRPEDLDVQVEKNILTIRGEARWAEESEQTRVYRREVFTGAVARSIRLPDNLNTDLAEAHFENGIVTIRLPKIEEPKPQSIKVQVKSGDGPTSTPVQTALPSNN